MSEAVEIAQPGGSGTPATAGNRNGEDEPGRRGMSRGLVLGAPAWS